MADDKFAWGKKVILKFKDSFFASDMNNVGDYLLKNVVIPGVQDLASNTVDSIFGTLTNAKDIFIYGEVKARNGRKINYTGAFNSGVKPRSTLITSNSQAATNYRSLAPKTSGGRYDFSELAFNNSSACKDILIKMADVLEEYQRVSVADFIEFASEYGASITSQPVDFNWGWTDLSSAYPKRIVGGWIVSLPPVVYLKR